MILINNKEYHLVPVENECEDCELTINGRLTEENAGYGACSSCKSGYAYQEENKQDD